VNSSEGLARLAKVVRWLGYLLAIGFVATMAFAEPQKMGWLVFLFAAVLAAAGWALAWVIEGFAKPKA
jgi:hypothetical protein